MGSEINLKAIEHNAEDLFFAGGTAEIACGIYLMGYGLVPLVESIGIHGMIWLIINLLICFALLRWGKKRFFTPRIGFVKLGGGMTRNLNPRKRRMMIIALTATALGILIMVADDLFFPAESKPYLFGKWQEVIFYVFMLVAVVALVGYTSWRFLVIGTGTFLAFNAESVLQGLLQPIPGGLVGWGIPGLMVTVFGIFALRRFMREHPVLDAVKDGEDGATDD